MINRVSVWLNENDFGAIVRQEALGGGSINQTSRLVLDRGNSLVIKENAEAPDNFFAAEAAGLEALGQCQALRIPAVVHVEADYLLLEDLGQASQSPRFWAELGSGLAALHSITRKEFGFAMDNYCGSTAQINTATSDGYAFYAEHRIMALARQADDAGLLDRSLTRGLEQICSRLEQLIPQQPAALLHGDLWTGNIHCCESGQAAILDPATYYGWPEAELAMTSLFGQFEPAFYEAYLDKAEVEQNWSDRSDLYNLYHLLNHLLLFGSSYLAPIMHTVKRYSR